VSGLVSVGLNPSPSSAVEHNHGPMLVLAGAGSGKTRVVTERIAWLILRGVASRANLGMRFTNKAAEVQRIGLHGCILFMAGSHDP
jgi:superfamily I DNA/RNA helicase